jgi:hypothetical protein
MERKLTAILAADVAVMPRQWAWVSQLLNWAPSHPGRLQAGSLMSRSLCAT